MTKENRAELRGLKKQQRQHARAIDKIIATGMREKRAIDRRVKKELRGLHRLSERTNRRILVVEGRLS